MTKPIAIAFPKTRPSPWLESEIRERVERLHVVCADILSCRVVVDIPHRHHRNGNRFSLRIEIVVPGEDLAVTRDANLHRAVKDRHEPVWSKRFDVEATRRDIRLVLGDAFDAAKRRLRDYAQRHRREVKRHPSSVRAFVPAGVGPVTARAQRTRPARAAAGR
jgi:hypothetical protein